MLTTQQVTTLRVAILAEVDPTFVGYRTNGQTTLMRDWLNSQAVPAVKCWNTKVAPEVSDEATPWANFDTITQAGKRESWVHAFMRYSRDYSKSTIRKWITDVWGNATVGSNAAQILTDAGLRNVTRAEAILGGTTQVNTNSVTAIKLTWEGPLTEGDISLALAE